MIYWPEQKETDEEIPKTMDNIVRYAGDPPGELHSDPSNRKGVKGAKITEGESEGSGKGRPK